MGGGIDSGCDGGTGLCSGKSKIIFKNNIFLLPQFNADSGCGGGGTDSGRGGGTGLDWRL